MKLLIYEQNQFGSWIAYIQFSNYCSILKLCQLFNRLSKKLKVSVDKNCSIISLSKYIKKNSTLNFLISDFWNHALEIK